MNRSQLLSRTIFVGGVATVLLLLCIGYLPIAAAQETSESGDLQDQIRQLKEQLAKLQASSNNGAPPPPPPAAAAAAAVPTEVQPDVNVNVPHDASEVNSLDDMVRRRQQEAIEKKRLADEAEAERRRRAEEEERLKREQEEEAAAAERLRVEEEERQRIAAEQAEAERLRLEKEEQRLAQEAQAEAQRLKELEAEKERLELEEHIRQLEKERRHWEEEQAKEAEREKRHQEELEQIRQLEEQKRLLELQAEEARQKEAEQKHLEELEQIRQLKEEQERLEQQLEEERQKEAAQKRLEELQQLQQLEEEKRLLEEAQQAEHERRMQEARTREAEKKQQLDSIRDTLAQLENDIKDADARQTELEKSYSTQMQAQVDLLLDALQELHQITSESKPLAQGLSNFKQSAETGAALRLSLDKLGSTADNIFDVMDTIEGVIGNTSKEWKKAERAKKERKADVTKFGALLDAIIVDTPVVTEVEEKEAPSAPASDTPPAVSTSVPAEEQESNTAATTEREAEQDVGDSPSNVAEEEPHVADSEELAEALETTTNEPSDIPAPSPTPSSVPLDEVSEFQGTPAEYGDESEPEADAAAAPTATDAPYSTAAPVSAEAPHPTPTEQPSPATHRDKDVVAELEARVRSKGYNLSLYETNPHEEVLVNFRSKIVLVGTSVLIVVTTTVFVCRGGCGADDDKEEGARAPPAEASLAERKNLTAAPASSQTGKLPNSQPAARPPSGLPQGGGPQQPQPRPQQVQAPPQAMPPQAGRPKEATQGSISPTSSLPKKGPMPPPPSHDGGTPRPLSSHPPEARSLFPSPPGHTPLAPQPPPPPHAPPQQASVPPQQQQQQQEAPSRSPLTPNQAPPPVRPRPYAAAAPPQEHDTAMEGELQNPFMQRWAKSE